MEANQTPKPGKRACQNSDGRAPVHDTYLYGGGHDEVGGVLEPPADEGVDHVVAGVLDLPQAAVDLVLALQQLRVDQLPVEHARAERAARDRGDEP